MKLFKKEKAPGRLNSEKLSSEKQAPETQGAARKKKSKKTRIIIAAVVIVLIVIRVAGCAMTPAAGAMVTTITAQRGDLQESVSTSGAIASENIKVVYSPVSGRVADVSVAAGDAVKAGDILVSFDMEEMEKTLREASLQQAKSNAAYQGAMADNSKNQGKLSEADVNLDVLKQQIQDYKAYLKDLQRQLEDSQRDTNNALAKEARDLNQERSDLLEKQAALEGQKKEASGDSSREAEIEKELQDIEKKLDDVNSGISYNNYVQQTASTSDYVAEMQRKIEEVREHIEECEEYKARMESQKSSSEGVVLDAYDKEQYAADNELAKISYDEAEENYNAAKKGIYAEFDGIVTECSAVAGSTVTDGMQLLTLESSGDVKVTFSASKYDLEKLELGQKVDAVISGSTYQGEISKINRMAAANASGTPMVGAEVHLLNPDDRIILGLDAKLTIYTRKAENALLVPVEAVNADKNGDFLYIVENGKVAKRLIVCGVSTDTYTEVVEGITEEDQIILTSYTALEEGMDVTVIPQQ